MKGFIIGVVAGAAITVAAGYAALVYKWRVKGK